MGGVTKFPPYAYPLGLANEALSQVEKLISSTNNSVYFEQYSQLKENLATSKAQIKCINEDIDLTFSKMIKISWHCILFSIFAYKGQGLLQNNNIQRLYREFPMWIIPRAYPEVINNWFNLINN